MTLEKACESETYPPPLVELNDQLPSHAVINTPVMDWWNSFGKLIKLELSIQIWV